MKTKSIISTGLIVLSLFILNSCDEMFDERIEGSKKVVTSVRDISIYDEVVSTGDFDVYISLADSTSLKVEAEDNLIPFIITKVSGQKFYIEEKENYRLDNNKPMKIFITTPNIEGLKLTGSGIINCDSISGEFLSAEITGSGRILMSNVEVDDLEAEISGSGDIIISGEGVRTEYEITGSGSIRAIDFKHEESDSYVLGSGNIYVYATEYLKASITGSGNIYYRGYPDINKHITGTGDIKRY